MSTLKVIVSPAGPITTTTKKAGRITAQLAYIHELPGEAGRPPEKAMGIEREELSEEFEATISVDDWLAGTNATIDFLGANGVSLLVQQLRASATSASPTVITVQLSEADLKIITAPQPLPDPVVLRIRRECQFVVNGTGRLDGSFSLQVAPVAEADVPNVLRLFGLERLANKSRRYTETDVPASLEGWRPVSLGIDGRFAFELPQSQQQAWVWWLTGPIALVGVQADNVSKPIERISIPIVIPSPPRLDPHTVPPLVGHGHKVPVDVTEAEVADNPEVFSEDPGQFCQPFSNPERILLERSFFTVIRVEQPAISARPTIHLDPGTYLATSTASASEPRLLARVAATGVLMTDDQIHIQPRPGLPTAFTHRLAANDMGRLAIGPKNPIQWETDGFRYQSASVALGHILEFRVLTRSNGYSLGTVAKTLTLAPRQAKRIQKIEWQRAERSRRQELTQFTESSGDSLDRERSYDDTVRSTLREWSRGESWSESSGSSGGFGFALDGFSLGGGGSSSSASSGASSSGGRAIRASEEQNLRDAIHRYGESLRRLESTVVTELSQEESVIGTSEVVRNFNYAHSLSIIYYQILRHLKVTTEVGGVRECLFVPFAITPFTKDRALRWRDLIRRRLRDRRFAKALEYLPDVIDDFEHSDIPEGARADQEVRSLYGSLTLQLGIQMPKPESLEEWMRISGFFDDLVEQVYEKMAQEFAKSSPGVAARWVDRLTIQINGTPREADFTLVTRYTFNGSLRVDFTVTDLAGVKRRDLNHIVIKADRPLPANSTANVKALTFTYRTDHFQRTVKTQGGIGDLIRPETGLVEPAGALRLAPPDAWELQDMRKDMERSVQHLVDHLNEFLLYYHKVIWWGLDRDYLYMLLDGFRVPGHSTLSVASVVERDPIGIMGNSLVYRVSAGSFLGHGSIDSPQLLRDYYIDGQPPREPMHIALPTDGLYAQSLLDPCSALEEHYGNTNWVLNEKDLELGAIPGELLGSRRAEPQATQPSPFPQTLINLQNAPDAPAPSGLAGVLNSVTNPNAFRDMAGLAGTQANAASALQAATQLASNFGNQAAALKMADIAKTAQAVHSADQQLASVQKAFDAGFLDRDEAKTLAKGILSSGLPTPSSPPFQNESLAQKIREALPGSTIKAVSPEGSAEITLGKPEPLSESANDQAQPRFALSDILSWADSHSSEVGDDQFSRSLDERLAFVEAEHLELGNEMVFLIDEWARKGLIKDGVMIDVKMQGGFASPIDKWDMHLPGDFANSASSAHWHFVFGASELAATSDVALRLELREGKALALSFGQILFMAGDWVESFEALAKGLPYQNAANLMTLQRSRRNPHDIDFFLEAFIDFLIDPPNSPVGKLWLKYVDKLEDVDVFRQALTDAGEKVVGGDVRSLIASAVRLSTESRYGALHVIAQTMAAGSVPTAKEINAFIPGIGLPDLGDKVPDERLWQILLTNGHFLDLALKNETHFNPENWKSFETSFDDALSSIETHFRQTKPDASFSIPGEALAQLAFGLHYMTDGFSAGHMRVPRKKLGSTGAITSKVMHDIDGGIGLEVRNTLPTQSTWRAYGDNYLNGPPKKMADQHEAWAAKIKGQAGARTEVKANKEMATMAVREAVWCLYFHLRDLAAGQQIAAGERGLLSTDDLKAALTRWEGSADFSRVVDGQATDATKKKEYIRGHQPIPTDNNVKPLVSVDQTSGELVFDKSGSVYRQRPGLLGRKQEVYVHGFGTFGFVELHFVAGLSNSQEIPGVPGEKYLLTEIFGASGLPVILLVD